MPNTIADIRQFDLFIANGRKRLADTDARQGIGAGMTTVAAYQLDRAGIADDGTIELGTLSAPHLDLPSDTPVEILERNVRANSHSQHGRPTDPETGQPATGDAHERLNRLCVRRDELRRITLLRQAQERTYNDTDIQFRTIVEGALRDGVAVKEIQETTGLSRARVYQIRDGRR